MLRCAQLMQATPIVAPFELWVAAEDPCLLSVEKHVKMSHQALYLVGIGAGVVGHGNLTTRVLFDKGGNDSIIHHIALCSRLQTSASLDTQMVADDKPAPQQSPQQTRPRFLQSRICAYYPQLQASFSKNIARISLPTERL